MITEFAPFLVAAQAYLWHVLVVFLRIGAVMSVLPAFGEQTVPVRVKLALAFAFTMAVAAAVPIPESNLSTDFKSFIGLAVTEPINGLALGLGFRLLVIALQTAGVMAAQALSLSQILGGAGADPIPALGQVLVVAGLALAVISGLHIDATRAMILSYSVLPIGQLPLVNDLTLWGVDQVSRSFALAFRLAAPFVIVSVLYNLTLGVINRAMPQLMVSFVGAPVITLGGLVLLMLLSPLMLSVWVDALSDYSASPFGVMR
jgi:flagellar biosynthetic protein FliR